MPLVDSRLSFFQLAIRLGALLLLGLFASAAFGQDSGGVLGFLRSETAEKYDLDPAAPDELLGVVVDADDKGVGGATVYLRPQGNWNNARLRQTQTDGRGQFIFPGLQAGDYHVAAVAGARATRTKYRVWLKAPFKPGLGNEPVVAKLKPAGKVRVRVVDAATKEPIPGADIKLGFWDLPRDRKADKNGETVAEGLPKRSYEFSATASGYAKKSAATSVKNTPEALVILELEPGAVIVGTARDPRRQPDRPPQAASPRPSRLGHVLRLHPGRPRRLVPLRPRADWDVDLARLCPRWLHRAQDNHPATPGW